MVECSFVFAYLVPIMALIMIPFGIAVTLLAGTIFSEDMPFKRKLIGALWVWAIGELTFVYGAWAMGDFIWRCF